MRKDFYCFVKNIIKANHDQSAGLSPVISVILIKVRTGNTVDREIFTLKIFRVKNFRVVKFSRFRLIREIFLTVDDCNVDERLESSSRLVYYQVSGEPGIAPCSRRSDIYPGECGPARTSLFTDYHRFSRVKFSR